MRRRIVSLMASFAAFAAGYLVRPIGGIVLSQLRRSTRAPPRVPVVGLRHVRRDARHGFGADVRPVGRGGERPDGGAPPPPGFLSRRRAPRRADLRRRNLAEDCAVRVRCRVRVRDDGGGRGDGSEPCRAHVPRCRRMVRRYGWRIAFIIGGLGGVLSFVLRRSLEESPEFERMRSLASRQPFREMLKTHPAQVFVGCAVLAGTGCFNGLFFSHLPAYLSTVLHYDPRQAVLSQTVGVIAASLAFWSRGGSATACRRAICCASASRCSCCWRYPFYSRTRKPHAQSDAAPHARRHLLPA